jgi:hypothetical protein
VSWIPAKVNPDGNRGGNDSFGMNVKKRKTHYTARYGDSKDLSTRKHERVNGTVVKGISDFDFLETYI